MQRLDESFNLIVQVAEQIGHDAFNKNELICLKKNNTYGQLHRRCMSIGLQVTEKGNIVDSIMLADTGQHRKTQVSN